jgi:hypothetical protein
MVEQIHEWTKADFLFSEGIKMMSVSCCRLHRTAVLSLSLPGLTKIQLEANTFPENIFLWIDSRKSNM